MQSQNLHYFKWLSAYCTLGTWATTIDWATTINWATTRVAPTRPKPVLKRMQNNKWVGVALVAAPYQQVFSNIRYPHQATSYPHAPAPPTSPQNTPVKSGAGSARSRRLCP
jgi:hypothetical protein